MIEDLPAPVLPEWRPSGWAGLQRQVADHILVAAGIAEGNVLERNPPFTAGSGRAWLILHFGLRIDTSKMRSAEASARESIEPMKPSIKIGIRKKPW
jgi:hypothetical protein